MVTLRANAITLEEVEQLLGFTPLYDGEFGDFLTIKPLSPIELSQVQSIRTNFLTYIRRGKVSEGQARQISINPILELAGYHKAPIELRIEEDVDRIDIKDKDTHIQGRLDIVAVNRTVNTSATALLWVLIVESKNLSASEFTGIAQMLTYAHGSLAHQSAVWGLVTNGATYQFFHIQKGETPTYQYFPSLRLLEADRASQLIQVLAAIRDWQP
jgi:Type I restriction enzyme R protein N terminus (HSDR_N)